MQMEMKLYFKCIMLLRFRTYIEQGARKKVLLSDKAYNRMKNEIERPKTPTLVEIQQHLTPQLESTFKRFWKVYFA